MKYLSPELLSFPFDQYQRYRLCAEVLERLGLCTAETEILEVGGHPGIGERFFAPSTLFIVDLLAEKKDRWVRANALSLPFADRSFKVVVSVDLLEHLLPEERNTAINELARVSAELVLISAPFQYKLARQAERLVFDFIKEWLGWEHLYLKEHLEIASPSLFETESELVKLGFDTIIIPNGKLENWIVMMLCYYFFEGIPAGDKIRDELTRFYNQNFFWKDLSEPAYRHLIVASRSLLQNDPSALDDLIAKISSDQEPDYEKMRMWLEIFKHGELKKLAEEIDQLKQVLKDKDEEIKHLRAYVSELEDFHQKVKSTIFYKIYQKLFKRKK